MKIKDTIMKALLAGMLIAFAGILYLKSSDKIIGSILFSLGLIAVVLLQGKLFTGIIGYVNSIRDVLNAGIVLVSNLVAAFFTGVVYKSIYGACSLWEMKTGRFHSDLFFGAVLCGICIYLAVELFKRSEKNLLCLILPVVAFILAGGEHCVADAFYMGAGNFTGLVDLLIIIIGNSLGSLFIRFLSESEQDRLAT